MEILILFVAVFAILYLFYLLFVIKRKEKLDKFLTSNYVKILTIKYKLDLKKINNKKFANVIVLANSFIIAFTLSVTEFVNEFILKLLIALATMILLIIIIYPIIGKHYRKESEKNV